MDLFLKHRYLVSKATYSSHSFISFHLALRDCVWK